MANLVIVCDPDVERRALFLNRIQPRLAPVEGLITSSCEVGDFAAVWAAYGKAPVSHLVDPEGAAIVWGMPSNGQSVLDAGLLRAAWKNPSSQNEVFDGYYAAAVLQPSGGVVIGADILGLFPIYYYKTDHFLLAASSPELFRYHPAFRPRFNPLGFAGIALTSGLFNGQTLWQDVHRLGPGYRLVWQPGQQPSEQSHYGLPFSTAYYDLTFAEQLDLIDGSLAKATAAQLKGVTQAGVLLSGGLDSRTVAAYLTRAGIRTEALTFGMSTDSEMRCAKAAVKQLGIGHHMMPIPDHEYPRYADLQTTWEHGADGFNNIWCWGFYPPLRSLPSQVAAGFIMDVALGGSYPKQRNAKVAFDTIFKQVNSWGLSREVLAKLLRPSVFGGAVEETWGRIQSFYHGCADTESRRTLCFKLNHRQRFHIGGIAWQMSFGAWPVLPVMDRAILAIAGGVPPATLSDRRAQEELLCRYFPHLAAIPLDANAHTTYTLRPQLGYFLRKYIDDRLSPLMAWSRKYRHPSPLERRHYYRLYDINGPGWRAVRHQAEPYRDCLADYFDMDALRQLLPAPEVTLTLNDGIIDASGLKTILGFMLWVGRRS